jgi:hypothetical protein
MYPWDQYDKFDLKITLAGDKEAMPIALVRRQWSHFGKECCSNGAHYFVKFKKRGL